MPIWRALVLALVLPALLPAQDPNDTGWEITSFHTAYRINTNRTIDVAERITVDFGELQRHGIYRSIPIRYNRLARAGDAAVIAGRETVDIALQGVTDANGNALETDLTRGDRLRIRIGSPDVTVTGVQVYNIMYRIEGGVGFFDAHDELYWQVTGTEWPVPIMEATARVVIPAGGSSSDTTFAAWCYAGWAESNSGERCSATYAGAQEFRFSSGRLEPGEGLTLVATFPKGIVPAPTAAEEAARHGAIWWPLAMPFVVFLGMYRQWYTRGREPHVGSIVPRWEIPDGLRAGAAGTLLDQRADMDDIVATLLELAVRGYITIREVPPDGLLGGLSETSFIGKALRSLGVTRTDWEIVRTEKPTTDLIGYELLVLNGMLEGASSRRMTDLHNDFYKHIPKIHEAMYDDIVTRGWFTRSPAKVRTRWLVGGIAVLVIGSIIGAVTEHIVLVIGSVLSGIIMMMFSNAMPSMTPTGARRYAELKGLEEYIRRAEKLELEMRQGPKRTTDLFEKMLPYAVALDATDIWVDQFAATLAATPPTWYVGSNMSTFNARNFSSSLNDFSTAATRTMGSSPGSSSGSGGGGSVGGGGGGGGGGSW